MKLPYLRCWDKTPVLVEITKGINENGAPIVIVTYSGKCCYSEKSRYTHNREGQWIRLNGALTIGKDIAPKVTVLEGYVTIGLTRCKIFRGERPTNPDGTTNHTKLELI